MGTKLGKGEGVREEGGRGEGDVSIGWAHSTHLVMANAYIFLVKKYKHQVIALEIAKHLRGVQPVCGAQGLGMFPTLSNRPN